MSFQWSKAASEREPMSGDRHTSSLTEEAGKQKERKAPELKTRDVGSLDSSMEVTRLQSKPKSEFLCECVCLLSQHFGGRSKRNSHELECSLVYTISSVPAHII